MATYLLSTQSVIQEVLMYGSKGGYPTSMYRHRDNQYRTWFGYRQERGIRDRAFAFATGSCSFITAYCLYYHHHVTAALQIPWGTRFRSCGPVRRGFLVPQYRLGCKLTLVGRSRTFLPFSIIVVVRKVAEAEAVALPDGVQTATFADDMVILETS